MKNITKIAFTITLSLLGIGVIYYVYWPFAQAFIDEKSIAGDSMMHLANIYSFVRNHPFIISAWKTEWGGYPVLEGYPWLHYYLIQPILNFFETPGIAMDYYSAAFLLSYYVVAFLLFYRVSRNAFLGLFFTVVLIYGADSQMPLTVNAFMTFTASMFFLPLILLITILSREKNSTKLFLISAMLFSAAFYSHGAMTGIVIFSSILPFVVLDNEGKLTLDSIRKSILYFGTFTLLSSVQIYQFVSYNAQGYLRGVKPFPMSVIPSRYQSMFSWQNPALLVLLVIFVPLLFVALKKRFSQVKPYLFSFLLLYLFFTLMIFNITSMNLVLLAERALWAVSLVFLVLFSKVVRELSPANTRKYIFANVAGLGLLVVYLYVILIVKHPRLVPDTLKDQDPYNYKKIEVVESVGSDPTDKYSNKYDVQYDYPPPSWSNDFDNYRTDGINWAVYSNWNIYSSNPRYKGRFPAAKGLPLEWSGILTASQYGSLGEAGVIDSSQRAKNQTLFFHDWYGIRYLEIVETDWPDYFREEPWIVEKEAPSIVHYHSFDKSYISPMYAPTNTPTLAVVAPKTQYDNFIRTISYTNTNSQDIIPIYLGSNLSAIKRKELEYFDAIFLYGYKSFPSIGKWNLLGDYVREGGNLIIETGQKVKETEYSGLPAVFPVERTKISVVNDSWNASLVDEEMSANVDIVDFQPLTYKYLPYSVSVASSDFLRDWAKPIIKKDGDVVAAYGQLGEGKVVWSGLNLPFHAIDNRNVSETILFANFIKWFFPENVTAIENFDVNHPKPEVISVKSEEGKGFLIKENHNPGWFARLNNKRTKIYKVGLFQMYIPFSSDGGAQELELNYKGRPLHWLLFSFSVITFVSVIVYITLNKNLLFWGMKRFKFEMKHEDDNY